MEEREPSERRVVHGKVQENSRGSHGERERAKLESAKEVVTGAWARER
jgi:hypothetical protein